MRGTRSFSRGSAWSSSSPIPCTAERKKISSFAPSRRRKSWSRSRACAAAVAMAPASACASASSACWGLRVSGRRSRVAYQSCGSAMFSSAAICSTFDLYAFRMGMLRSAAATAPLFSALTPHSALPRWSPAASSGRSVTSSSRYRLGTRMLRSSCLELRVRSSTVNFLFLVEASARPNPVMEYIIAN